MGFGAEMKDFVSGFKTGYSMFKSPEEREDAKVDREFKKARTEYTRGMLGVQAQRLKLQQEKAMKAGTKKVGGNDAVGLTGSAAFDRDFGAGASSGDAGDDTLEFAEGGRVERQDRDLMQDNETKYTDEKGFKYAIPEGGEPMRVIGGPQGDASRGYFPEVGEALDSGLRFLSKTFGLDKQGQAVGDDPGRQKAVMAWQAGAGGVSPEEVAAAEKVVDPEGKMKPGQRRAAVLAEGYKFTKAKKPDDPEAPARYAASVLQAYKREVIDAGYAAEDSLKKGDMVGAIQALKAAYDSIPNGNDVDITSNDDGYIAQFIGPDGKPVGNPMPVTPQLLQQQIMAAKSGLAFNQEVMSAASAQGRAKQAERGSPEAVQPNEPKPPQTAIPEDPDVPAATPPGAAAPAPSSPPPGPGDEGAPSPEDAASLEGAGGADVLAGGESSSGGDRPRPPAQPRPPNTQGLNAREARAYLARYRAEVEGPYNRAKARYDADLRQWRADQNAMQRVALSEAGANQRLKAQETGANQRELSRVAQEERAAAREEARRRQEADPDWKRNIQLEPAQREMARASSQEQSTGGFYEPVAPDVRRRNAEYSAADVAYRHAKPNQNLSGPKDEDGTHPKTYSARTTDMVARLSAESARDGNVLSPGQQERLVSYADDVAKVNDTNPEIIANLIYKMATGVGPGMQEPRVNPRTGEVTFDGMKVVMPSHVLMQLAQERGKRLSAYRETEMKNTYAAHAADASKKQGEAKTTAMTGAKSPARAALDIEASGDMPVDERRRVARDAPDRSQRSIFYRWLDQTPSASEARRNVGDALGIRGRTNGR